MTFNYYFCLWLELRRFSYYGRPRFSDVIPSTGGSWSGIGLFPTRIPSVEENAPDGFGFGSSISRILANFAPCSTCVLRISARSASIGFCCSVFLSNSALINVYLRLSNVNHLKCQMTKQTPKTKGCQMLKMLTQTSKFPML